MDSDCGSDSRNNISAEMTQSPQKTYLGLNYTIILEQPERKFALSDNWNNLFIMNSNEQEILEYVNIKNPPYKFWHKETGNYSERVTEVFVSSDNVKLPTFCQIKISGMITKTYKFTNKIIRTGGRHAF